jgi:hypothetical protein
VTDLVLIYETVTSSASVVRWLTLHSCTLGSFTNESSFTNDFTTPVRLLNELSFITRGEPRRHHYLQQFVYCVFYPLPRECVSGEPLASNRLPYPLFATGMHVNSVATNPLPSNRRIYLLFRLSDVIFAESRKKCPLLGNKTVTTRNSVFLCGPHHAPKETGMHVTIEELMEAVFFVLFGRGYIMSRFYNCAGEGQQQFNRPTDPSEST